MAANTKMKQLFQKYSKQATQWNKTAEALVTQADAADKTRSSIHALATSAKEKAKFEMEKDFWNNMESVAATDLKPSKAAATIALSYAKSIDKDFKGVLKSIKATFEAAKAKVKADKQAAIDAKKAAVANAKDEAKREANEKKALKAAEAATKKAAAFAKKQAAKGAKSKVAKAKAVSKKGHPDGSAADAKVAKALQKAGAEAVKKTAALKMAEKEPLPKILNGKQVTLEQAIDAKKAETKTEEKSVTTAAAVKTEDKGPTLADILAPPPAASA